MDPHTSSSPSYFNDQLEKKDTLDNLTLNENNGDFLNKEMKKELIHVLAKKEALRILRKNNLKDISQILEKHHQN